MRECIYCGRTLEKGEKCTCAMSVLRRMEKESQSEEPKSAGEGNTKKKKEKPKKERVKKPKKAPGHRKVGNSKNEFLKIGRLILSFIKSPIDTIMNPGEMSWVTILVIVAFTGIIGGLAMFSVITGAVRGPISFLGNAMGFGGLKGYEILKGWLLAALSGAVSGVCVFFLYSTLFYLVNKWIIRLFTPYREFVKRFTFVGLPLTVLGAVGVILGLFSQTTFVLLIICGLVGNIIITYEILRSMWYSKTPGKIMYLMMFCIFIFLLVLMNFIKIA